MRVSNTPFTVYDFFGYFIPGFLLLVFFLVFYENSLSSYILPFFEKNEKTIADEIFISAVFVMVAYIAGLLISFLSSYTIESILRELYGAAGCYLMMDEKERAKCAISRIQCSSGPLMSFLSFFYCLPTIVMLMFFGNFVKKMIYSSDKLVEMSGDAIREQLKKYIRKHLNNATHNEGTNDNTLFLLAAASIKHLGAEQYKYVYNYLTLSGMTRAFSFVSHTCFWWYLCKFILSLIKFLSSSPSAPPCYKMLYLAIFFAFVADMFFLMYMKFERRYAEEVIICAIHANSHSNKKRLCLK